MKSLILISIFATFLVNARAQQDTIVSIKGLIIPAYIVGSDTLFISYKVVDTLNKEINLIQKSNLLLIKYKDGKTDRFYKNDTLITMEGVTVLTKIIEINSDMLTCFFFDGIIHEPTIVPSSNVFMIKLQDGTKEVIDHKKTTVTKSKEDTRKEQIEYNVLGQKDAEKYFKTDRAAITGEVILGSVFFLGFPAIGSVIIAYVKPTNLQNSQNPNDGLLTSNANYKEGYLNTAKIKKRKACTIAFCSGAAATIGTIGLLIGLY